VIRGLACGGDVNSMLQFLLEGGSGGIKHCQKIKRRQRAHLGKMGWKCDTVRRRDDVSRRRGDTEEGKGRRQRQLDSRESYWTEK
jgi:hypothetical protein